MIEGLCLETATAKVRAAEDAWNTRLVAERADAVPALAELFREHGFDGTSLALVSERMGLGKGSLYHFFPGGKEEMVTAVLAEVETWFEANVFSPLRDTPDPHRAVRAMFRAIEVYFQSGHRVCLVRVFSRAVRRLRARLERLDEVHEP